MEIAVINKARRLQVGAEEAFLLIGIQSMRRGLQFFFWRLVVLGIRLNARIADPASPASIDNRRRRLLCAAMGRQEGALRSDRRQINGRGWTEPLLRVRPDV